MTLLDKNLLNDFLDDMIWSYTRLNSFYVCKRGWYYTYILKNNPRENFFSQYGVLAHKTFEKYNKGELELFELKDFFNDNYYNFITEPAPPNKYIDLDSSYFEKGVSYFSKFQGEEGETLGAEEKIEFSIFAHGKDRKFIGYIDRISKDCNGLIITDYKSKGKFKSKKEIDEYSRQLYLYSIGVKEKYGVYPYKMIINQFKENRKIEIYFDENKISDCKQWVSDTIDLIFSECNFDKNENDFFCNYICSVGLDVCSI